MSSRHSCFLLSFTHSLRRCLDESNCVMTPPKNEPKPKLLRIVTQSGIEVWFTIALPPAPKIKECGAPPYFCASIPVTRNSSRYLFATRRSFLECLFLCFYKLGIAFRVRLRILSLPCSQELHVGIEL